MDKENRRVQSELNDGQLAKPPKGQSPDSSVTAAIQESYGLEVQGTVRAEEMEKERPE
jgi:hypothetical protein